MCEFLTLVVFAQDRVAGRNIRRCLLRELLLNSMPNVSFAVFSVNPLLRESDACDFWLLCGVLSVSFVVGGFRGIGVTMRMLEV